MTEEEKEEFKYVSETTEWVIKWLEHKLAVFTPIEKAELTRMLFQFIIDNPGKERGDYLKWAEWLLRSFIRR